MYILDMNVHMEFSTCPDVGGWVSGGAVGLNDNNAILISVDVVVEVGVELGKNSTEVIIERYLCLVVMP